MRFWSPISVSPLNLLEGDPNDTVCNIHCHRHGVELTLSLSPNNSLNKIFIVFYVATPFCVVNADSRQFLWQLMCKTANAVLTSSAADLICCCSSKNGKMHHFDKGEFLIVDVPVNKDMFDCTFFLSSLKPTLCVWIWNKNLSQPQLCKPGSHTSYPFHLHTYL